MRKTKFTVESSLSVKTIASVCDVSSSEALSNENSSNECNLCDGDVGVVSETGMDARPCPYHLEPRRVWHEPNEEGGESETNCLGNTDWQLFQLRFICIYMIVSPL